MKYNLFVGVTAMAILGVIALGQTSRLSSDGRGKGLPTPPTGTIFVPPSDSIFIEWRTNETPLAIRVEVSSNVVRRSVWFVNGRAQTNDQLLSSNLISTSTNSL